MLVGSFDVYVSNKLIAQAIMYLKKEIGQTQEYISKISLNDKDGVQRLKEYTNDLNDYIDSLEMLMEVAAKREKSK